MNFNKVQREVAHTAATDAKSRAATPKLPQRLDARAFVPASALLQGLLDDAPADYFTLGWLLGHLHRRSFGVVMLILALVAMMPGISIVAGLLLTVPAFEMIAGCVAPIFPRRIASRPIPTRHLAGVVRRAVPVLKYLEKAIRPRWHTPLGLTKRVVGLAVLLLTAPLVLTPVPMSQVVPGMVISLLSLAYLEDDGVLLLIALLASVALLTLAGAAVWGVIVGALWIGRSWF